MTQYLVVDPQDPNLEVLVQAAGVLRAGGIVAFPTESVYALGVAAADEGAVRRLRAARQRDESRPLSYLLPHPSLVTALVDGVSSKAQALMNRYWPGPLTLVMPVSAGEPDTVSVRVPAGRVAQGILSAADVFVLGPSARRGDSPPAISADMVREYFDADIDLVVDGGTVTLREPSTVVVVDEDGNVNVIREGIISREMVHQLVSGKSILFVCSGNTCRSPMAEAFFRRHLAEKLGKSVDELPELGYRISSAGIYAAWGSRATDTAVTVMKEHDCDLSSHVSRPLTLELLREADRIFAMTPSQLETLLLQEPACEPRAELLSTGEIQDPIGGDIETYRECAMRIGQAVEDIVAKF